MNNFKSNIMNQSKFEKQVKDFMRNGAGVMITFTRQNYTTPDAAVYLLNGKEDAFTTYAFNNQIFWIKASSVGEIFRSSMADGKHYCAIYQIEKSKRNQLEKLFEDAVQADPVSKRAYDYAKAS